MLFRSTVQMCQRLLLYHAPCIFSAFRFSGLDEMHVDDSPVEVAIEETEAWEFRVAAMGSPTSCARELGSCVLEAAGQFLLV